MIVHTYFYKYKLHLRGVLQILLNCGNTDEICLGIFLIVPMLLLIKV